MSDFHLNNENSTEFPRKRIFCLHILIEILNVAVVKFKWTYVMIIMIMFKEIYCNAKIGHSELGELRWKYCMTARAAGIHSVCVNKMWTEYMDQIIHDSMEQN